MTRDQIDGSATMNKPRTWQSIVFSDLGILFLLGLPRFVPLLLPNAQTAWHCDELARWIMPATWPGATWLTCLWRRSSLPSR